MESLLLNLLSEHHKSLVFTVIQYGKHLSLSGLFLSKYILKTKSQTTSIVCFLSLVLNKAWSSIYLNIITKKFIKKSHTLHFPQKFKFRKMYFWTSSKSITGLFAVVILCSITDSVVHRVIRGTNSQITTEQTFWKEIKRSYKTCSESRLDVSTPKPRLMSNKYPRGNYDPLVLC